MAPTGRDLLTGLTVPLVTPLNDAGRPDAGAAPDLWRAMAGAGVRRLMLLGTNGEGPLLATDTLGGFLDDAVARWRDADPTATTVVNVSAAGGEDVHRRARLATAAGADALVLCPPFYFHHSDEEIVALYRSLDGYGIPVIVYHIPRYAGRMELPLLQRLLALDHVCGIKDSSGDAALLAALVGVAREHGGVGVSQGSELQAADGLRAGADGVAVGLANLAPGLGLRLLERHQAGDDPGADAVQAELAALYQLHAVRPGVPAVKEILAQLGLCPSRVAPPLLACTPDQAQRLAVVARRHADHLLAPLPSASRPPVGPTGSGLSAPD